jgi:N-acyl-D-aspartate/D-glutamate deacylase
VGAYFREIEERGAGTNVIHLVPHGDLRREVLGGGDRAADPRALRRMEDLLGRGLEAGAWGMSTGLIYLPGRYADTAELVALAKVVAGTGGSMPATSATRAAGCCGRSTRR